MRILGADSSDATFRWDLLFLLAQLSTDERPGIAALAAPIEAGLNTLETRRVALDQAPAAVIMAVAMVIKRDKTRDRLLVNIGGVARATDGKTYAQFFPKLNPSQTAKLGVDAESVEVLRILGEMKALDSVHPLRTAYESNLTAAQTTLEQAKTSADSADLALTLERSQMQRCKLDLDKLRVETHGKLVALLADKNEADSFFRPTTQTPGESKAAPAPAPAKPEPASTPTTSG